MAFCKDLQACKGMVGSSQILGEEISLNWLSMQGGWRVRHGMGDLLRNSSMVAYHPTVILLKLRLKINKLRFRRGRLRVAAQKRCY
jgi:hypothetical protein